MKRACLLSFVLLLFLPVHAAAQNSDWDKVLDRYQDICGQCITLRDRIVAGEPVSDRAVTSLLQELGQLRSTLQNASGSMTDEQRMRLAAIRDSYSGTSIVQGPINQEQTLPTKSQTSKPNSEPSTDTNPIRVPDLSGLAIAHPTKSEPQVMVPSRIEAHDQLLNNQSLVQQPISTERKSNQLDIEAYIIAGYNRSPVFGGMITVGRKSFKSGYISVLTNGSLKSADYSCLSNGNIQGGGVFWGDGSVADNALFITGGLSVWNSRTGNISAYLGAGYGINERLWRDISGKWAIVSDLSGRGIVFQAAAAFHFNHVALSPSLIYMPSTNYILPSIGLGYSF